MKSLTSSVRWVLGGGSGMAATIQTVMTRFLILTTNIATGVITARTLAPVGRGEQAAITLWPQFLAFALTLGLPSALLYNLKRYPEKRSETFAAALLLGTGLGFVATFVGILFIPRWLSQYSPDVIRSAQLFMLMAPLSLLGVVFTAAFEANDDFTTANQVRYLAPFSTLIILLGLVATGMLTPVTAGIAYLLPGLPIALWMIQRLWKQYQPVWQNLMPTYRRLMSYGIRAYGIDLLGTLSGQIDQVLVVGLLEPASMGMYAVALSLSRMIAIFQSSVVTVLFPKAAARPVQEAVALTGQAARISMAFTLLVAIAVMFLGPVLLRILYGFEFLGSIPVFRLLLLEVVVGGTAWVLTQAFMALGQPGIATLLQAIGLGTSVPLMVVLIPRYGLVGAGISLLSASSLRLILALLSFPIVLKVRPPSLLINRNDIRLLQDKLLHQHL
ncbi:polysaccharide biosynthesis protein [filamentous cyanobacterium CCP1]|nr:polysaccharide biosynthesis protein [filamentous cyanobacterium CCP2]PSB67491.1 polysaccharide biosynthesis protein [filamentous cyanobacterium CCP1]